MTKRNHLVKVISGSVSFVVEIRTKQVEKKILKPLELICIRAR